MGEILPGDSSLANEPEYGSPQITKKCAGRSYLAALLCA